MPLQHRHSPRCVRSIICDGQQAEFAPVFDIAARFGSGENGLEMPFIDGPFSASSGLFALVTVMFP